MAGSETRWRKEERKKGKKKDEVQENAVRK